MSVHTGERRECLLFDPVRGSCHSVLITVHLAFVCHACSRRFSVQSNLTRHTRICPEKAAVANADESAAGLSSMADTSMTAALTSPASTQADSPAPSGGSRRGRKRPSPPPPAARPQDSAGEPKPKRRRRAPSSPLWLPDSLRGLDLSPLEKATPVPLPPVQPFADPRTCDLVEERDSFDDHVPQAPYHPKGWTGRLPGPALMDQESLGILGGRLLVF